MLYFRTHPTEFSTVHSATPQYLIFCPHLLLQAQSSAQAMVSTTRWHSQNHDKPDTPASTVHYSSDLFIDKSPTTKIPCSRHLSLDLLLKDFKPSFTKLGSSAKSTCYVQHCVRGQKAQESTVKSHKISKSTKKAV